MSWDATADIVVVGSGAAGLSGALFASDCWMSSLVLESSATVGGTSALAGGGMWVPANRFMEAEEDSESQALLYLTSVIDDCGPASSPARRAGFVRNAPRAIEALERLGLRFRRCTGYPDYYPRAPGACARGRAIESAVFDLAKLGTWRTKLPSRVFPRNLPMGSRDVRHLVLARRTVTGFLTYARIVGLFAIGRMCRRHPSAGGAALVGQLLHQALQRGIPVRLGTSVREMIYGDDRILGVIAERDGRQMRIQAARGVLLAAGGFARNARLRRQHHPDPVAEKWSLAGASDMGEGISLGVDVGAAAALMEEAWWMPCSVLPDGTACMHNSERTKPGSIIVDEGGTRYMNEAQSYNDVVRTMLRRHNERRAVPSWLIFDHRFRRRYPFGSLLPGKTPKSLVDAGYIKLANEIGELALQCGIEPFALRDTVQRFNTFARRGTDEDYGRGSSEHDKYLGDPGNRPNPCLGPLQQPPFYAVALYPGDLGTKGGLLTDEHGRVLREDGSAIAGLYASGNNTASVMGRTYPGPGSTLGPALTFSFLAMRQAAAEAIPSRSIARSSRNGATVPLADAVASGGGALRSAANIDDSM